MESYPWSAALVYPGSTLIGLRVEEWVRKCVAALIYPVSLPPFHLLYEGYTTRALQRFVYQDLPLSHIHPFAAAV